MDRPRVLVTGGAGFIGSWVVRELLARQCQVIVHDRQPSDSRWNRIIGPNARERFTFVSGELTDRQSLELAFDTYPVTHVIHLAALLTPACQQDPYAACAVNILGSVAVWEAIRQRLPRPYGLSHASSLAVYGPEVDDNSGTSPVAAPSQSVPAKSVPAGVRSRGTGAENQPPTFYGATKKAFELLAHQYWLHYGIGSIGIRPHVVYGPEREQGISAGPSLAARAAARGESYTIGFRGRLGYDYVEDVARAFVDAAFAQPSEALVVDLPSCSATPEEIVSILDELVPGSAARIHVAGPPIPSNVPPQSSPITRIFPDWKATSLRDGLSRTVDFYR